MPDTTTKPTRSTDAIVRDIAAEREALKGTFDALAADLSEAAEASARWARETGRKAAVVLAAGGAVAGGLLGLTLLIRRHGRSSAE